jgi:hypothetical protein
MAFHDGRVCVPGNLKALLHEDCGNTLWSLTLPCVQPDTCELRMRKRGRAEEGAVKLEYLKVNPSGQLA